MPKPKPSVMEILEAGRKAGEPIAATLARVRRAYPRLTEAALDAEVETYLVWLLGCGEQLRARVHGRMSATTALVTGHDPV